MSAEISSYHVSNPLTNMSSRKPPLANNYLAVNSPIRPVAGGRAKRSFANVQREEAYGQPPPAKRLMRTPPRGIDHAPAFFNRKSNPTPLTKQLAAARTSKPTQQSQRIEVVDEEGLESVRNWQRHYRQVFPNFVFYFESVPEDARAKLLRQIAILNAVSCPILLQLV